jgi:hypothetical protein
MAALINKSKMFTPFCLIFYNTMSYGEFIFKICANYKNVCIGLYVDNLFFTIPQSVHCTLVILMRFPRVLELPFAPGNSAKVHPVQV